MNNIKLLNINNENLDFLIENLLHSFKVATLNDLPENYGNKKPWSLLSMIENNQLDCYNVVICNNKFWSGSGGKLLESDSSIYHAGLRMFTNPDNNLVGLTRPAYTMLYALPYQIERAKKLKCKKVILTFNKDKTRLFEMMKKYMFDKKRKKIGDEILNFKPLQCMVNINNTMQWVLELELTETESAVTI